MFHTLCSRIIGCENGAMMRKVVLVIIGFVLVILVITAINSANKSATKGAKVAPSASETPPASQVPDVSPKESWNYGQNTDKMTGKITQWACLDSADELQFGFPYNGGSTGTICVRKGRRLDAYFKIGKGQVLCGVEGCEARLKVNGGEPFTVSGSESADGDPRFLFFDSYPRILAIAKKAKQIKVEVLYYQEGRQVLTFEPSEPLDPKW